MKSIFQILILLLAFSFSRFKSTMKPNKLSLLFVALFCLFYSSIKAQNSDSKPNVVFIIVDDLNDYEGVFGGHPQVKTPNIDKLAKSGITFTNAHSNCPVCSPSRNSLFTGVYPLQSKDFGWTKHFQQPVLKNNKTLVEYFNENGYYTLGSGKLLHVEQKQKWNEWGIDINNYGPLAFNGIEPVGHPSVPEPYRNIGPIDGFFCSAFRCATVPR